MFLHPDGPGRSETLSLGVDSRVAAQLSVHPTPRLSAYVQVVSEQDTHGSYDPQVEWANVQYDLTPNISIRAGRTSLATFLVSNHRKVGYAIPWVRPPAEVYQLLPVTSSDGADFSYRWSWDGATYSGQFAYGRSRDDGIDGDGWSWTNSVELGVALFHVSYTRAKVEFDDIAPLFGAIEQFGPEGQEISRRYDPDKEPIDIVTVGASYDPGDWFLMAEWGRSKTDSVLGHW